jgi:hypothetical protein
MNVVYGGVGYPSFHYEVAEKVRREITAKWTTWKEKGGARPFETVEDVGRLVVAVTQRIVRRRVDEKLKFFYGFTTDDFLRGSFTTDGAKIDIGQAKVKDRARAIIEFTEKSPMTKSIYENVAVLIGHDAREGMGNYHIKAENCVLSLVSGRSETIGKGKYASAMVLTHYLGNKTLAERRAGLDPVEGTVELISATLDAEDYFHEAGGSLNLLFLDGRAARPADRVRAVTHHAMKLATEAVMALRAGLVSRETAEEIVHQIVFKASDVDRAEKTLFAKAKDPKALEFLLRGYKVQDWRDGFGLPAKAGESGRISKGTPQ